MRCNLLHLGVGNVGGALVAQILAAKTDLAYCGLFTVDGGIFEHGGLSPEQIAAFPGSAGAIDVAHCIRDIPAPFVLIDTTATDKTLPLLKQALGRGGAVVMSNKKPLSGAGSDFDELHKLGGDRLWYETTVGAGLPVIHTLKTLLATGDNVTSIQGCFSGTLGFIFSQLATGRTFSQAVQQAKQRGYTEPDPRDDLSGMDVARKALILARMLGHKLEMSDIKVQKLYPEAMQALSVEEFFANVTDLDKDYAAKTRQAQKRGQVLRFVATIQGGTCRVGLEAVPKASDIGCLQGPDNIIVFKTERYAETPLVIKGPGAGLEVTAAGVFGDVLGAAKVLHEKV